MGEVWRNWLEASGLSIGEEELPHSIRVMFENQTLSSSFPTEVTLHCLLHY